MRARIRLSPAIALLPVAIASCQLISGIDDPILLDSSQGGAAASTSPGAGAGHTSSQGGGSSSGFTAGGHGPVGQSSSQGSGQGGAGLSGSGGAGVTSATTSAGGGILSGSVSGAMGSSSSGVTRQCTQGGDRVWDVDIGSSADEDATPLLSRFGSDLYFAATVTSTTTVDVPLRWGGGSDALIAYLDPATAAVRQEQDYGDSADQTATALGAGPTGTVAFGGAMDGRIDFDADTALDVTDDTGDPYLWFALLDASLNSPTAFGYPITNDPRLVGYANVGGSIVYAVAMPEDATLTVDTVQAQPSDVRGVVVGTIDAAGQPVWSSRYGDTPANVDPIGMGVANDGTIVVAGSFSGGAFDFEGTTLNPQGGTDTFLFRLDANGGPVDAVSFHEPSNPRGLLVNGDRSAVVLGDTTDTIWVTWVTTSTNATQHSWQATGPSAAATGDAIAADGSQGLYIAGSLKGTLDFGGSCSAITSASATAGYVAHLDGAGECQWVKLLPPSSPDAVRPRAIAADANAVYVAGSFSTIAYGNGTVSAAYGGRDFFVAALCP
jgi:hypothetical protein